MTNLPPRTPFRYLSIMATGRPSPKKRGATGATGATSDAERRTGEDRREALDRRFFPRPEGRRKSGGRRATDRSE